MDPIFLVVLGGLLFVAIFSASYALLRSRVNLKERVLESGHQFDSAGAGPAALSKNLENFFKPLGKMVGRSPDELSKTSQRLIRAGYRRKDAVFLFYGVRVVLALALFGVLALFGMPVNNPLLFFVLPIFLAAALPDLWLNRSIKNRKLRLQLALPDMTDLTVICVEAGMGLDQAVHRIQEEIRLNSPDLSDELRLYNLEINAGKSRAEALRNLSKRTGVEDLKSLTTVLIQADRFGTSIGQTLRTFADSLRTKRRQRAEEIAAQMNVKMIFPLLLFIFPAVFVVVAGPAVIAIARDLLPALGGGR